MDTAVGLVETYLRLNGYFTVTEFPVLLAEQFGLFKSATDIDILACRFAHPHGLASNQAVDPALGGVDTPVDMIIGEVKEGKARMNESMTDNKVLAAALIRFGCCDQKHVPSVLSDLSRHGRATTHCGHRLRLIVFSGKKGDEHGRYEVITLGHINRYIEEYVNRNWSSISQAQIKDPILAMFSIARKSETTAI